MMPQTVVVGRIMNLVFGVTGVSRLALNALLPPSLVFTYNCAMRNSGIVLLFLTMGYVSWGQQSTMGPLGVVITPHPAVEVSEEIRAVLPKGSIVRLTQQTHMAFEGELVVLYDASGEFPPDPHLAVVRNGHAIANFSLATLFGKDNPGPSWELFAASEFRLLQERNVFIAAYRNIGDGSGTVFVLLSEQDGHYTIAWKRAVSQGRFKVLQNGKMELWEAQDEGACVWCPHPYKVTTLRWSAGRLAKIGRFTTKSSLDPSPIADDPIVIEK
jgi:hypothetical protein